MSINILPTPSSTVPIGNDDYTAQNGKIEGGLALSHEILTGWELTGSVPDIAQGAYIYHSGNLYSVDGADDAISGGLVSGINYIEALATGTILTCSFTTDISGYSYNQAYNGMYNGTKKLLNAVVYVFAAENKRGVRITNGSVDTVTLQDGTFFAGTSTLTNADVEEASIGALEYGEIHYRAVREGTVAMEHYEVVYLERGLYNLRVTSLKIEVRMDGVWQELDRPLNPWLCSLWCNGENVRLSAIYGGNPSYTYTRA